MSEKIRFRPYDSKSDREELIENLREEDSDLYDEWENALKRTDQTLQFLRESNRYSLSGQGDLNTYPIFTELASEYLTDAKGRAGLVVKTGIATDYHTRDLFAHYVENDRLVSLFDFENTRGLFADVERNERFCLLTLTGPELEAGGGIFSFHNQSVEQVRDDGKLYELTPEDFNQINPNTKSCPTFKNKRTRDIAVKLYRNHSVLVNDEGEENPWSIKYHYIYHMSNDSGLFSNNKLENLQQEGYKLAEGNILENGNNRFLPLYEGKLITQFDHRFGTFEDVPSEQRFNRKAETRKLTAEEKKNHNLEPLPRYWVSEEDFKDRKNELGWDEGWIFSFRNVARSHTDFRTSIGTITPFYPHGHSAPVLTFDDERPAKTAVQFTTLFTSFSFDFALRQSIGGANFTLYILKQLPMPAPSKIASKKVITSNGTESLEDFLVERGLDLLWTSHSLDPLGDQFDSRDQPNTWEEDERRKLRAELEAAIAQLYGLTAP